METIRTYWLSDYHEAVWTAPWVDDIPTWDLRPARDYLADRKEDPDEIAALDEIVIDEVLRADDVPEFLLRDDPVQPLKKWWWHLDAIRRRAYPVELLPEYLRAVYLEAGSQTC